MISLQDIEDITDLTREEIAAIAEHEHVGMVKAAIMGNDLMHKRHGPQHVQQIICEDIRKALYKGDLPHARALFATLRQFLADHPEAVRGAEPR